MAKAKTKTLEELFHDTLKDIYFAEKKILAALPKMARRRRTKTSSGVRKASRGDRRPRRAARAGFERSTPSPRARPAPAIVGIIEEGQEIIKEYKGTPALDAGLSAAQAVEHYEIARYGTLETWADELGLNARSTLERDAGGGGGDRQSADRACQRRRSTTRPTPRPPSNIPLRGAVSDEAEAASPNQIRWNASRYRRVVSACSARKPSWTSSWPIAGISSMTASRACPRMTCSAPCSARVACAADPIPRA